MVLQLKPGLKKVYMIVFFKSMVTTNIMLMTYRECLMLLSVMTLLLLIDIKTKTTSIEYLFLGFII